ncbi:hypothetical protein [Streptomyces fragilis]|uniref:DUF3592 domain-containing protein n=1 Tax=Streptomyces fragilis TaxID=67301 RepID=A0ABV2YNH9_9ACTN|nr:hypothetical protein [Streptomyces fragilis]
MPAYRPQRMSAKAWAGAGAAGVLTVLVIALIWLPGPWSDLRAYEAAPVCRAGRSADDCRTVTWATVTGTERVRRGGTGAYRLTLRLADGSERTVTLAGLRGGLGGSVGERAGIVTWRGSAVEVARGPDRDTVTGSRLLAWRPPLVFLLLLTPATAAALWTAGWLRRRQRWLGRRVTVREAAPAGVVLVAAVAAAVGGLPIALSASGPEDALRAGAWLLPAAAVVAAPFALWVSARPSRERREVPVSPRTPVSERVVQGFVRGDVPYSKEGFDRLVVGPGLLAATPDPSGRVARAPVPVLEVVRVRESWPDEALPEGRGSAPTHVVECRDADREVLIVVRAEDVPEVLGALRSAGRA